MQSLEGNPLHAAKLPYHRNCGLGQRAVLTLLRRFARSSLFNLGLSKLMRVRMLGTVRARGEVETDVEQKQALPIRGKMAHEILGIIQRNRTDERRLFLR